MVGELGQCLGLPDADAGRQPGPAQHRVAQVAAEFDPQGRRPQVGTRTVALAGDGADLAAALQTVREIGDASALDAAVNDAFPGATVAVADRDGLFDVEMRQPALLGPLGVAELSEGRLRYLLLVAALLSPVRRP